MAMGTEKSKALHNFMMPGELRWGNQRFLRCMKINSNGQISPPCRFATNNSCSSDQRHHKNSTQQPRNARDRERGRERDPASEFLHGSRKVGPTLPPPSDGGRRFSDDDGGIAATREKVMFDLQTAAYKMKETILKEGLAEGEGSGSPPAASVGGEIHRPSNLRTRRAACRTPLSRFVSGNGGVSAPNGYNDCAGKGLMADTVKPNSGFSDGGSAAAASGEKRERRKFSVALPKRDMEEDFLRMVGHRPPRRPKKRARIVQRQLDTLFPGLWLTEVTADMYKVSGVAP